MNIWLINNYNMMPVHGQLNRNYYLGEKLSCLGHNVVVYVGSHPHNTDLQLIEGKEKYRVYQKDPFHWVLIKTCNYEGSKLKQIFSMFQFYFNVKEAVKNFERPDAIVGSSAHPLAAFLALKLKKRYNCKSIVEIRDLWPESIVAYGILRRNNPITKLLYRFEKYLYKTADAVVFTMEGAYQYIIDRGWEKDVPSSKVFYVNNGVDLDEFDYNKEHFILKNESLARQDLFKVVYTGSIKRANNIGMLVDAAKRIKNSKVKILIWGAGEEVKKLQKKILSENLQNIEIFEKVDKKYIPYIVSHADLNIAHNEFSDIIKYGISLNKMFDYLAAGKPVFFDFECKYNPAIQNGAGFEISIQNPDLIAKKIDEISLLDADTYSKYAINARKTAGIYDYKNLAKKMEKVINSIGVKE